MEHLINSAEQMRQLINEIDSMSRRNFLKKGGAAAVSAVVNPKVDIGSLGGRDSNPEIINDKQKLTNHIVNFLKRHKDQGETHPVYHDLVDYSKKAITKLKTGWTPSKEELAKVWIKQDNLIRDIYSPGAEDPSHDWIFDDEFFGYDRNDLENTLDKMHVLLRKIDQAVPNETMNIPKQRNEYYKKITDQYANMLKSDDDVPATFDEMDEKLKKGIVQVLDQQDKNIETVSAEELKIILSKMDYNHYEEEWVYNIEDEEEYVYNPAEDAFLDLDNGYSMQDIIKDLNIPYDPKEFEYPDEDPYQLDVDTDTDKDTDIEPAQQNQPKIDNNIPATSPNKTEPEIDKDENNDEYQKDKKSKSAQESIRYYINMIEEINKR